VTSEWRSTQIEDAIPLLLREGGPRFATYVCDMNKRADEVIKVN
jgi:hypothetical protein